MLESRAGAAFDNTIVSVQPIISLDAHRNMCRVGWVWQGTDQVVTRPLMTLTLDSGVVNEFRSLAHKFPVNTINTQRYSCTVRLRDPKSS